MWYNLSDELERKRFATRAEHLSERGAMVELTEHRPRSLRANDYLHAIITCLALELGEHPEYVKQAYYKREANPDLFIIRKNDARTGKAVETLRSSAALNEDEFSLSITRFRDWSSRVCGVYLPSGDEHIALQRIQHDISRAAQWLPNSAQ